jgi:hypothetical protein
MENIAFVCLSEAYILAFTQALSQAQVFFHCTAAIGRSNA